MKFTALLHHLTVDLLRERFYSLKRKVEKVMDEYVWRNRILTDFHGAPHSQDMNTKKIHLRVLFDGMIAPQAILKQSVLVPTEFRWRDRTYRAQENRRRCNSAAPGGFTAASENPVYVLGDYNSNSTDTVWNTPPVDIAGHAAASVIADAVTFLSSNWSDHTSLGIGGDGTVTNPGNRNAGTNFYRLAVAGGKNMNFPRPTSWGAAQDFGTDGGVHNFLRYLENWGGTLNYKGSIVSLYYATYNTGIYKCCTTVYSPPTRNYSFDLDFTSPGGLPPGTPMFRDVESLGFRQLFATRKSGE